MPKSKITLGGSEALLAAAFLFATTNVLVREMAHMWGDQAQVAARFALVWLMKQILRTGVELTYERSGRFTRDLWLCCKDFSEYYPDFTKQMYRVLYLALNPTADLEQIDKIRSFIIPFLQGESVRQDIAKIPLDA